MSGNLSDFFGVSDEDVKDIKDTKDFPIAIKEKNTQLAVVTDNEVKEYEKNARIDAIKDLKKVSEKSMEFLDLVITQLKETTEKVEDDMSYIEPQEKQSISPATISSLASLINAIGNVNGKLLDDGKKRVEKIVTNTQNNVSVTDVGGFETSSDENGKSNFNYTSKTTSEVMKELKEKKDKIIEGEIVK